MLNKKKEVGWLFACLYTATQDVDSDLLNAVKGIEEKLRIAQVKETLKRK